MRMWCWVQPQKTHNLNVAWSELIHRKGTAFLARCWHHQWCLPSTTSHRTGTAWCVAGRRTCPCNGICGGHTNSSSRAQHTARSSWPLHGWRRGSRSCNSSDVYFSKLQDIRWSSDCSSSSIVSGYLSWLCAYLFQANCQAWSLTSKMRCPEDTKRLSQMFLCFYSQPFQHRHGKDFIVLRGSHCAALLTIRPYTLFISGCAFYNMKDLLLFLPLFGTQSMRF